MPNCKVLSGGGSLVFDLATQGFHLASRLFAGKAPLDGPIGRLCGNPMFWLFAGALDELCQTLARDFAISGLAAGFLNEKNKRAILRPATACQSL